MNEAYMRMAIELAKKGAGAVSPNPMVGAVAVKNDRIIAKGYHEKYGGFHAERNALTSCTEDPADAELYVTLEPCCHYGKTPPCTEIIIEKKIKKVYIGSADPNPLVAGKGAQLLRDAGIEVIEGVLRQECDSLNRTFFHYITKKTPYVLMKYAMTADGKIATKTGHSQWISCEESRQEVQRLRHEFTGIMVGINTVLTDDPMLTCRIEGGKNPVRILCDSGLNIPLTSKIAKTAKDVPTVLATVCTDTEKIRDLENLGITVLKTKESDGRVDLSDLMVKLGERKIDSILLEGGGTLNESALRAGIVQRVLVYIAPKILGGEAAKTPVSGIGAKFAYDGFPLQLESSRICGDDLAIEYAVKGAK